MGMNEVRSLSEKLEMNCAGKIELEKLSVKSVRFSQTVPACPKVSQIAVGQTKYCKHYAYGPYFRLVPRFLKKSRQCMPKPVILANIDVVPFRILVTR